MTSTGVVLKRDAMVCESSAWSSIFERAGRLAPLTIPVVITGETGTGKCLIAHQIHKESRRDRFVRVDCPTIPEALFESEIFGSEPGAFTGSLRKNGLIDEAMEGTLLLDEVTHPTLAAQGKLLRLLDDRKFRRIGGRADLPTNARIIATSNQDFGVLMKAGSFRPDLFYRLNEASIHIPPLRERQEDIIPFIRHFLAASELNPNRRITLDVDSAAQTLLEHPWPGNAREVRNAVNETLALTPETAETISTQQIADVVSRGCAEAARGVRIPELKAAQSGTKPIILRKFLQESECRAITDALNQNFWSVGKAAKFLGLERSYLYKKMVKYGIKRPLPVFRIDG